MYETSTENYPAEYDVIEVDGQRVTSPSVLSVFGTAEQKEALVSPQPVLGITRTADCSTRRSNSRSRI
jgi:hypothetical protein